jgi:hypothetical protein
MGHHAAAPHSHPRICAPFWMKASPTQHLPRHAGEAREGAQQECLARCIGSCNLGAEGIHSRRQSCTQLPLSEKGGGRGYSQ